MHSKGAWPRRGFTIAILVLTFVAVAPELAAPAGAVPARLALPAKRPRAVSPAARRARIVAAMRAKAAAIAKYKAAAGATGTTAKPKPKPKRAALGAVAKRKRALAARRLAVQRAAAKRRNAAAIAARRAARNKKKSSSLSLPLLALLAVAPFVLIGLYLLGADYLRRREPRKRGGASLVITRAGNR
jgi:hypothetical protein